MKRYLVPAFAILFGLATLKEGGSVLFVDGASREAAGHYIPWLLWFNFATGFALLAMGAGILLRKAWTSPLASTVAVLSLVMLGVFLLHIAMGGEYEPRTLVAMPLRTAIWGFLAWWVRRKLPS